LNFIGSGSISGVWSPDSVPEPNCITVQWQEMKSNETKE
jgi:hypothetical protein